MAKAEWSGVRDRDKVGSNDRRARGEEFVDDRGSGDARIGDRTLER